MLLEKVKNKRKKNSYAFAVEIPLNITDVGWDLLIKIPYLLENIVNIQSNTSDITLKYNIFL